MGNQRVPTLTLRCPAVAENSWSPGPSACPPLAPHSHTSVSGGGPRPAPSLGTTCDRKRDLEGACQRGTPYLGQARTETPLPRLGRGTQSSVHSSGFRCHLSRQGPGVQAVHLGVRRNHPGDRPSLGYEHRQKSTPTKYFLR